MLTFEKSIFRLVVSFRMINYFNGECPGRLISRDDAFRIVSKITTLNNLRIILLGKNQNKIWNVPQLQQPITIQQLSATIVKEYKNVPAVLILNAFDGMVNPKCRNAAGHS